MNVLGRTTPDIFAQLSFHWCDMWLVGGTDSACFVIPLQARGCCFSALQTRSLPKECVILRIPLQQRLKFAFSICNQFLFNRDLIILRHVCDQKTVNHTRGNHRNIRIQIEVSLLGFAQLRVAAARCRGPPIAVTEQGFVFDIICSWASPNYACAH